MRGSVFIFTIWEVLIHCSVRAQCNIQVRLDLSWHTILYCMPLVHFCLERRKQWDLKLNFWCGVADWRRCLPGGSGLQSGSAGEERQRASQAGSGQRGHQGQNLQIPPGKFIHHSFSLQHLETFFFFQILELKSVILCCPQQRTLQKQSMTYGGKSTVRDRSSGTSSSVAFTPLQVKRSPLFILILLKINLKIYIFILA